MGPTDKGLLVVIARSVLLAWNLCMLEKEVQQFEV